MSDDPNHLIVELPVKQLPDGTVRVGYEPKPEPLEPFKFPVVPNEPVSKVTKDASHAPDCRLAKLLETLR